MCNGRVGISNKFCPGVACPLRMTPAAPARRHGSTGVRTPRQHFLNMQMQKRCQAVVSCVIPWPNRPVTAPNVSLYRVAQEFIMSAFTSASFNPIRSIPEDIKHTTVTAARAQKVGHPPPPSCSGQGVRCSIPCVSVASFAAFADGNQPASTRCQNVDILWEKERHIQVL